jgi:23S rRNA (adenine2503-C2)-methyltransferase
MLTSTLVDIAVQEAVTTETPLTPAPSVASDAIAEEAKPALVGMSHGQLLALCQTLDEPAFRAAQLHHWLYVKSVRQFERMTNLAKPFRQKLAQHCRIGSLQLFQRHHSQDGTVKYLFRLDDGRVVESVLMHFDERQTYAACISTQVGCAVNCGFCATGKLGFTRNLTIGEIVEQYQFLQADSGKEIRNLVFMGQGEPLLNYDNLIGAIRVLNQSAEVGMRRMTISTAGIVPKIEALAEENLQATLAISLHAPDNATREQIMPITKKWPLEVLVPALHHYVARSGRRLTVEYILLAGCNDSTRHARQLAELLQGLRCNVNLIPYNPIASDLGQDAYHRPSRAAIYAFREVVAASGKKVTIRVERGVDIGAACGQLANKV